MPGRRLAFVAFRGFGDGAVDFFEGLSADNSKAYWSDHQELYASDVRAPMDALLAELATEFGEGKVFRPYRDVRFAKDKRPYKTHCGGVVERGRGGGAYYVQLGADGLMIGGGSFHLAPDQLQRFRTALDDERRAGELATILAGLRKRSWEIAGNRLQTRPRGYPADHPRLDLLRYRSLYVVRRWEPDGALHESECLDRVRRGWRQLRGINEWMADHVGPSAAPR